MAYLEPIESKFDRGFKIWYVADYNGPLVIVAGIDAILVRDDHLRIWNVIGTYVSAYTSSPFLSDIFGLCSPLVRKELNNYPTPKWGDNPIEIEVSRVKICYY